MSLDFNERAIFGGAAAILGGALIFFLLIVIAVVVFQIIAAIKVYKKAGRAGWEAIVPYYDTWVLCEIAGVKWWFFLASAATLICGMLGLFMLEPLAVIVSLLASFAIHYNIALKFGKDGIGYGIGLTLLPVVFYAILGFGSAEFKDVKVSCYGPITEEKFDETFKTNTTSNTGTTTKKKSNSKAKFCKNCGAEIKDAKFCPNCGTEIH